MNKQERAEKYLEVLTLLSKAQTLLDGLAIGDTSTMPSELKHSLDEPKERIRSYARALYQSNDDDDEPDQWIDGVDDDTTQPTMLDCPRMGCSMGAFPLPLARRDDQGNYLCPRCGAVAETASKPRRD